MGNPMGSQPTAKHSASCDEEGLFQGRRISPETARKQKGPALSGDQQGRSRVAADIASNALVPQLTGVHVDSADGLVAFFASRHGKQRFPEASGIAPALARLVANDSASVA